MNGSRLTKPFEIAFRHGSEACQLGARTIGRCSDRAGLFLRVKMLNEARHITYSTGCQHRCEYRFTGPCFGGPIPGSGIDARYALVRLPFLEPTKTGAFFVLAARLCPGAIIDTSTLPLRRVREWPSDCFPNPVATPTCFETPLRFSAGYSGRFAGWRCSVLGYKCQHRRYKAKNRSLKLPPPATRPGPRSIFPSCTMSKTFQWDSSGNKRTRGP
jgi:hypothetical protein